jgi:microcystin-dependent protein
MSFRFYKAGKRLPRPTVPAPTGMVVAYPSATPPSGWLLCDGTSITSTNYPALHAVLNGAYGGSGSTATLPDLRNKVPVGAGTGAGNNATGTGAITGSALTVRSAGTTGGAWSHPLTAGETGLRVHNHTVAETAHTHTIATDSHRHLLYYSFVASNVSSANTSINQPDGSLPAGTPTSVVPAGTTSGYTITALGAGALLTVAGTVGTAVTISANTAANGTAHENAQPHVVVHYIIKT